LAKSLPKELKTELPTIEAELSEKKSIVTE